SRKAAEIAEGLNAEMLFIPNTAASGISWATAFSAGKFGETLTENWKNYDAHVFVMACGIVVRHIAPLLADKLSDPAVVVCDENGGNCISLLSGHVGGANRLARIVAGVTGGNPVITTATDVNKLTAFDELAALCDWRIVNRESIKLLNSLLLENKKIDLLIPQTVFEKYFNSVKHLNRIKSPEQISAEGAVLLDCPAPKNSVSCLMLKSKSLAVGIGCRRNTPCQEIEDAVKVCLDKLDMDISNIKFLASLDAKKDEKGLLEFAEKHNLEIEFYPALELDAVECPGYSPRAAKEFGTGSVAEAAAMLSSGSDLLLLEKQKFPRVTVAAASYVIPMSDQS
ncbi:MAG: cobalamin biosynthesis protein, partial [Victivallales bacterium]|nr:cobalamin biosynthesis protein [Victivallales bacterium]